MLIHWLWLSQRPGVNNRAKAALAAHFLDAEAVYFASEEDYTVIDGLSPEGKKALMDKDLAPAEKLQRDCARKGVHILTFRDAAYPARLRNIADPPVVLYYKGVLPDFDSLPMIAVVGTRHPSVYGGMAARKMGFELASCGGAVVSGLAAGIDAAAMEGALDADGIAVGVLGCGIDRVYPAENRELFSRTEQYGCILSEYAPGVPPVKWNFPQRNRIISGLCLGVTVVEAPARSGSLITANQAAEQGRDVFVLPGNVDTEGFKGSIGLLRSGAIAVTCGWDVMAEYEHLFPGKITEKRDLTPPEKPEEPKKEPDSAVKKEKMRKAQDKKTIDKVPTPNYIDLSELLTDLSPEEQKVISAVGERETLVDDVILHSGLNAGKVLGLLTMLEMKGKIVRHPGRRVSLNERH